MIAKTVSSTLTVLPTCITVTSFPVDRMSLLVKRVDLPLAASKFSSMTRNITVSWRFCGATALVADLLTFTHK